MEINVTLDDHLIKEAAQLGGFKSKKAAVTQALLEFIQRHKQAEILDLFGAIEYDADYDYKKSRQ